MPGTTAQQVILALIRNAGGAWEGKERLYKGFYFAHLYYADQAPGLLTDWPIARLPRGPGIDKGNHLLKELETSGYLTDADWHDGPYPDRQFQLTPDGIKAINLPTDAAEAVRKATEFCKNKTTAELSQIAHDRSRSWQLGKNSEILDIYIDLVEDDDEFADEQAAMERLDEALKQAL